MPIGKTPYVVLMIKNKTKQFKTTGKNPDRIGMRGLSIISLLNINLENSLYLESPWKGAVLEPVEEEEQGVPTILTVQCFSYWNHNGGLAVETLQV